MGEKETRRRHPWSLPFEDYAGVEVRSRISGCYSFLINENHLGQRALMAGAYYAGADGDIAGKIAVSFIGNPPNMGNLALDLKPEHAANLQATCSDH